MFGVRIAGLGMSLPDNLVTNDMVAAMLMQQREKVLAAGIELTPEQMQEYETNNDWIRSRVGVESRRFALPDEVTSDFGTRAAHDAWTDAYGDGIEEIPDFLIVATVSPDHFTTPPTAAVIQRKMGIPTHTHGRLHHLIAADVTLACSSFMTALTWGVSLIQSGQCKRGLVIGTDVMSRVMSSNRRSPFVILGDGAGAMVLEATTPEETWFPDGCFLHGVNGGPNGAYEKLIINPAGGSAQPITVADLDPRCDGHLMIMDGREVYEIIVPLVANELIPGACERAGLSLEDIHVLILHQANLRMIDGVVKRMRKAYPHIDFRMATQTEPKVITWDCDKHVIWVYNTIDHTGNPTSGSIPMGLYEARERGIIFPGKRVLGLAFGGGFSNGSAIFTWGK